jgi:hypothetical protein
MGCEQIDRYLLGEPVSKPAAIEAALAVRELRAFAALARACATEDGAGVTRLLERDAAMLSAVRSGAGSSGSHDLAALGAAARTAYASALSS